MNIILSPAQLLISLAATGLLVTACGSSSSGRPAAVAGPTSATPVAATAPVSEATGKVVTIMTKTGPLGTYLTDQSGRTLYLWVADTGSTSTCSGPCAAAWPPLTGTATAAGSVTAAQLATSARSDGSMQVTYDGHPLYYFEGDTGSGTTAGQGNDGFGAKWWVVGTNGAAITGAAAGATSGSK